MNTEERAAAAALERMIAAEVRRSEPVQRNDNDDDLVYKTTTRNEGDGDWRETVAVAIAEVTAHERAFYRQEFSQRDARIAALEAKLDVLTKLFASKAADVVDLPNWKKHHGA